jgi:hypothetical protein
VDFSGQVGGIGSPKLLRELNSESSSEKSRGSQLRRGTQFPAVSIAASTAVQMSPKTDTRFKRRWEVWGLSATQAALATKTHPASPYESLGPLAEPGSASAAARMAARCPIAPAGPLVPDGWR